MMFKTIIAVVIFLVLALIFQLYEQNQLHVQIARQQQEAILAKADKEAEAKRARQLQSGVLPQSVSATENLAMGTFSVPSGSPREFRITVDSSRMMNVTVAGQFAVSGKNSGIEVYIFDEDDYTNWMYGNDSIALYDSGRKTMGEVRTRIEKSGRYFLIFQNSSSSVALAVHAEIQLQYEKITTPTG
jgi:hypothetical protein